MSSRILPFACSLFLGLSRRKELVIAASAALPAAIVAYPSVAHAEGTFRVTRSEVTEVSGAWHVFVTIELPRPPAMPHVPLKFLFTKLAVYERSLVDGKSDPVTNRQTLQNQRPTLESLPVDFADSSGKIFKGTRFDFGLTRARGYEAGEYEIQIRTSDGVEIGKSQRITLKGDNPVVDRRSIAFNAQDNKVKKIESDVDGGPGVPKSSVGSDYVPPSQEVDPVGTAPPFISDEAHKKTPEEELKVRPKGCGCDIPGATSYSGNLAFVALGAIASWMRRRTRKLDMGTSK